MSQPANPENDRWFLSRRRVLQLAAAFLGSAAIGPWLNLLFGSPNQSPSTAHAAPPVPASPGPANKNIVVISANSDMQKIADSLNSLDEEFVENSSPIGSAVVSWPVGEKDACKKSAKEAATTFSRLGVKTEYIQKMLENTRIARIGGDVSWAMFGRIELSWRLPLPHEYAHILSGWIVTAKNAVKEPTRMDGVMESMAQWYQYLVDNNGTMPAQSPMISSGKSSLCEIRPGEFNYDAGARDFDQLSKDFAHLNAKPPSLFGLMINTCQEYIAQDPAHNYGNPIPFEFITERLAKAYLPEQSSNSVSAARGQVEKMFEKYETLKCGPPGSQA